MNTTTSAALSLVAGFIGLATLAVILSPKAQTPAVLNATGGALGTVIGAAVAPVTGTGVGGGSNTAGFSAGSFGGLLNFGSQLFGGY